MLIFLNNKLKNCFSQPFLQQCCLTNHTKNKWLKTLRPNFSFTSLQVSFGSARQGWIPGSGLRTPGSRLGSDVLATYNFQTLWFNGRLASFSSC